MAPSPCVKVPDSRPVVAHTPEGSGVDDHLAGAAVARGSASMGMEHKAGTVTAPAVCRCYAETKRDPQQDIMDGPSVNRKHIHAEGRKSCSRSEVYAQTVGS